ncbi:acetyl-CoA hydrolase/transferase C-terminal domain-containing protein [Gephyromycinifex aptenodytis]|uniref:acetyl-CoA hydrolase/transferase C-terminal domain-containing protein n=1 Tax=Gephyromycinifex aptenodytis TaxID=2716227 RepID=UPI0038560508
MISDGILALVQAGAMDRERLVTCSFMFGSPELFAWAHRNEGLRVLRTETVNAPGRISQNPGMTSINTALQVDLFDQANASRIETRIHSGFGGQTDFTVGAIHAPGGQAIMALRSWHPKVDVSTIVPLLDQPVTSFQHSAVVTENGIAELIGQDEKGQARHLIDHAAHPRVRDELWEEAYHLGLT